MSKEVFEKKITYGSTAEGETNWFPFFCLRPRKVEGKWMWLKTIERKITTVYWHGTPMSGTVEYRLQNKLRTLVEPMFRK